MAALDKQSGRTLWTTEPLGEDRVTHSSPILFRHAGRRVLANCSSGHGFGVDADTGKLLWTVPLRNAYGIERGHAGLRGRAAFSSSLRTSTEPATGCGRARTARSPRRLGARPWIPCTGAVLLVDGVLYGSGYQKHKSWLCLDWKTGQTRYEFKGLTTGAAVYADGRLYCLAEDGRAALLKPTPGRIRACRPIPPWCRGGPTTPGPIRSCSAAGSTFATTIRSGATTCRRDERRALVGRARPSGAPGTDRALRRFESQRS